MILETMLERLSKSYSWALHELPPAFQSPAGRPISLFSRLKSAEPNEVLHALLNGEKKIEITSNVSSASVPNREETLNEEQKQARRNWDDRAEAAWQVEGDR